MPSDLRDEALHPTCKFLLVGCAGGMRGDYVAALLFGAVLADFELAFEACYRDAKSHDSEEHGAAEAFRHGPPLVEICRFVNLDEFFYESVLGGWVFNEFKRAEGVYGDVIPGGNRERLGVERRRNVTVGAGEDDQRFMAGELFPMLVCAGKVAEEHDLAVLLAHHQGKVRRL